MSRRPSRASSHGALQAEGVHVYRLSSPASGEPRTHEKLTDRRPSLDHGSKGHCQHSKQKRRSSAPDLLRGAASRPASATGARRQSLSEALDEAQDFLQGQLRHSRWRHRAAIAASTGGSHRASSKTTTETATRGTVERGKVEVAPSMDNEHPPLPVLLQDGREDAASTTWSEAAKMAWTAPLETDPLAEKLERDGDAAPRRESSRLSEMSQLQLGAEHHKDLATVWSSVWFRTHVKPLGRPGALGPSPHLGRTASLGGSWTEGGLQKGILQRLSYNMSKVPHRTGHQRDPGKALLLVVASSGLMPAWLPESLDVEDEDDLFDALVPVTGTVFRHWCHARESEIRVDDLLFIFADLGIEAVQELLEQALAGNIYATLDWPDFVSVLKDYRRLERLHHKKTFHQMSSEGSLGVEDVEVLLNGLGQPAALQAVDAPKDRSQRMNFHRFEEFLRHLRLTEGFSQHDLRELHAFFEVEKTSKGPQKEPRCLCTLAKVQQVMMLRGFPTTEEEVEQMAEKLGFSGDEGVSFREMLRLIRCLKELERTQMLEIIQKYSQERRNAIQVSDLPLALGGLGYYPDEDAIKEHLGAIGSRVSEDCLTPEELAKFLQKYRQVSGFTREQYQTLAQSFAKADKMQRGQLNALELTEVLRRAGFHVSMQDVIQALYHFDLEGIGLLSLPEALKLLRGLLAKEAEQRRNAFLAGCRGPAQKLPARDLAMTIAKVRGYQPDKTVLASMLSILGLHSMNLTFSAFEHVCKLMRESDVKFMQNHSGYTPEQVAELKVHYQSYDEDTGVIPGANLPKLFLAAFPLYATCARQQQITRNFMEEVNQSASGWTFEVFLGFVRMAEDEACQQDLIEEEELVQQHGLTQDECRGFREIFVSKAEHNCAVTDEEVLDMFDFATSEFNQEQRLKFFEVMKDVDRHYCGSALRFPDFLRFMKRLTDRQTEENLGLVRASLRLKRLEEDAEAWFRSCRAAKRGLSRAGSLFFRTELDIQRIKSQSSSNSEKSAEAG